VSQVQLTPVPAEPVIKQKLKKWQKIFVNRSLNMSNIRTIGFDLDHTLITYNRENFEALAFRETVKKFIAAGYPEELLSLKFDPNFLIRGLLVDIDRGNLLKVDCHKYVKIAFHGHQRLEKNERHRLYNSESFKAADFLSVDTFFALSEVQLFTEIVDFMDRNPGKLQKTYREVYQDLRRFIDLSHADGSIKSVVLANPEQFIVKDKYLTATLMQLLEAGKSLFVLTNSAWEYTNALMEYVYDQPVDDFPDWRSFFDHIIVGSGKPGFFTGSQPFYEVVTDNGLLKLHSGPLDQSRVYHGGNANLFQKLSGYRGDEILFVGDHIYGDIMRSKDSVNWRTLLILEELIPELSRLDGLKENLDVIKQKLNEREALDQEIQILRSKTALNTRLSERAHKAGESRKAQHLIRENEKILAKCDEKQDVLAALDQEIRRLVDERHAAVHPQWGELMKSGLERSRFADQVAEYACVYTSSVTNMRFYSPFKRFSSTHDILPHDL
jgi:HAD superfamily 5'-nucleotidase-like hydrolase